MADILESLRAHGVVEIQSHSDISHGPTIGDMYEGLTRNLLSKSLPDDSQIRVTSGFIDFGSLGLSTQQDCMIVDGSGVSLPYTDSHKYLAKDVLAIIEVKANFQASNMNDAIEHLAGVRKLEKQYWDLDEYDYDGDAKSVSTGVRIGAKFAGRTIDFSDRDVMASHAGRLARLILDEARGITRIAYSPRGYKTPKGFREALLRDNANNSLLTNPSLWPSFIGSASQCAIKLNGLPYQAGGTQDPTWMAFATFEDQTLYSIMELIWTKISLRYNVDSAVWGSDLQGESGVILLTASHVGTNWELNNYAPSINAARTIEWMPITIYSAYEDIALNAGQLPVRLDSSKLSADDVNRLIESGLFVLSLDGSLVDVAGDIVFIATGNQTTFADNAGARFEKWLYRTDTGGQ